MAHLVLLLLSLVLGMRGGMLVERIEEFSWEGGRAKTTGSTVLIVVIIVVGKSVVVVVAGCGCWYFMIGRAAGVEIWCGNRDGTPSSF